jgi:hypothetical protein
MINEMWFYTVFNVNQTLFNMRYLGYVCLETQKFKTGLGIQTVQIIFKAYSSPPYQEAWKSNPDNVKVTKRKPAYSMSRRYIENKQATKQTKQALYV